MTAPLDLDAIEARAAEARWLTECGDLVDAIPALVAEVRRLRLIVVDCQLGTICRFCHSRPCRCDVGARP